jgi:DNA-binding NarL/FixJ family response regulator
MPTAMVGFSPPSRRARRAILRSMPLRVMVVDDSAPFRRLLGRLLHDRGIEVVGEAQDGRGALELARERRPDAAVVDVHLGEEDGVDLAGRLAALPDPPRVLLSSSDAWAVSAGGVQRSGACAFVAKSELADADLVALLS